MATKTKNEMRAVLKNKFLCQDKFTNDIENLVQNNLDMNYIEAICHYCEQNSIEIESVSKLITKPMKEKLRGNAMNLNYLKRTSRAKFLTIWGAIHCLHWHHLTLTKSTLRTKITSLKRSMTTKNMEVSQEQK